jgi:hypothetical protein
MTMCLPVLALASVVIRESLSHASVIYIAAGNMLHRAAGVWFRQTCPAAAGQLTSCWREDCRLPFIAFSIVATF